MRVKEEPEESDVQAETAEEEEEPEKDPEPIQEQPQPDEFKGSRFGRIIKPPERLKL